MTVRSTDIDLPTLSIDLFSKFIEIANLEKSESMTQRCYWQWTQRLFSKAKQIYDCPINRYRSSDSFNWSFLKHYWNCQLGEKWVDDSNVLLTVNTTSKWLFSNSGQIYDCPINRYQPISIFRVFQLIFFQMFIETANWWEVNWWIKGIPGSEESWLFTKGGAISTKS